jgi:hypothetical protein
MRTDDAARDIATSCAEQTTRAADEDPEELVEISWRSGGSEPRFIAQ